MPIDPDASIEVTAYRWVPPMARGFVKDMRVRWALEEIGLPYRVRLVGARGARNRPSTSPISRSGRFQYTRSMA